jgi:plasmid replication initiation protein
MLKPIPKKKAKKKDIFSVKNEVIVQHNNLVEARYRLSLQEKRVILWLISQIHKDDEDFKVHTINIKEFCELAGVESNNMYKEIEKVTMRLIQRGLSIRNLEEKSLIQVSWLNAAKYRYDEGLVELCFSPYMQPFLLNLKEQFTKITLSDVMQLHSAYAIRLYELLKQYETLKKREISILDLREYCGISKDEYKKYNDFKRKIIETALREIDKKSDITFSYTEVKQSRKIVSIIFDIFPNPNYKHHNKDADKLNGLQQIEREAKERKHLVKKIMEYGFSDKTSYLMIQELDDIDIKKALEAVDIQIARGQVRNTKAMIRTAFKEKWKPDVSQAKN